MAKFRIECPHCGVLNTASTGIFSKKIIECAKCHTKIDIRAGRFASRRCPSCKSEYVYDMAKDNHICPICHKKIDSGSGKIVSVPCPQCGCTMQVDANSGGKIECPVCSYKIDDIQREINKSRLVADDKISVIKYEGKNDSFVWKHPIEDFNWGSQLIVHESQEAIFMMNGRALDLFGPGRYTLETENLPLIGRVVDAPTGRSNPFHAEIYFINKTHQSSIKWGTDSRVRFIEPETEVPLDIGAHGELTLQVSDSRKLLIKLVGTMGGIAWEGNPGDSSQSKFSDSLRSVFWPHLMTTIKSNLSSSITSKHLDILSIDSQLGELSETLREKVSSGFEEYGLAVPRFFVTDVDYDREDPNIVKIIQIHSVKLEKKLASADAEVVAARRSVVTEQLNTKDLIADRAFEREKRHRMAETEAEADRIRRTGFAQAEVMAAQGYNQKDVLEADVRKEFAAGLGRMSGNGGGGGITSDVVGLGVGLAAMGQLGSQARGLVTGIIGGDETSSGTETAKTKEETGWKCECGCDDNRGKFCSDCGKPRPETWDCLACGEKDNKGKFCSNCGKPKPEAWDCPACGEKGNKGRFCSNCGKSRDEAGKNIDTWDCNCGNKNIKGNFCSNCGKKRDE